MLPGRLWRGGRLAPVLSYYSDLWLPPARSPPEGPSPCRGGWGEAGPWSPEACRSAPAQGKHFERARDALGPRAAAAVAAMRAAFVCYSQSHGWPWLTVVGWDGRDHQAAGRVTRQQWGGAGPALCGDKRVAMASPTPQPAGTVTGNGLIYAPPTRSGSMQRHWSLAT